MKSIFNPRLVAARDRDSLNDIRNMNHRIHTAPSHNQIGARDLAGPAEVLTMPDEIMIEEQLGRKFSGDRRVGVENDFPTAV